MSQLSREECIELGLSVPVSPLIAWAAEQHAVAKGRLGRLEDRGVTAPFLAEIKSLAGRVMELQKTLGKDKTPLAPEVATFQEIREEATAYCLEAKQILKIEFGSCPEIQVQARLGIRTGRLLANLRREVECVVRVMREHASELGWLGVDESFIGAGEALVGKLNDAQALLEWTCKIMSVVLAEQCCAKGKLYDLTRKLVRIGQLEYLQEPEQAAAFNYSALRKELRAGSEVRVKAVKTAGR